MSLRFAGALSGVLGALALPPFSVWPLALGALVPLGLALSEPASRRDVVAAGLWFGALFYGIVLYWVPFTLHGMTALGPLIGVLAVAMLVPVGAAQALVAHRLLTVGVYPPFLVLPAVWVTSKLLLRLAGPLAMPWSGERALARRGE